MPTDLISRLSAGRFEGDNAEVVSVLCRVENGGMDVYMPGATSPRNIANVVPLDSLDDALRLVPEGWRTYDVSEYENRAYRWHWSIANTSGPYSSLIGGPHQGQAPTPAHALTLAILRAKEADRG